MKPHGQYKLYLEGDILHVYPFGGFNVQGIIELHQTIILRAPSGSWALFEHLIDKAGLTPDAVSEVIRFYRRLQSINCVAAALEMSPVWQGVFEEYIVGKLDIPIFQYSLVGIKVRWRLR